MAKYITRPPQFQIQDFQQLVAGTGLPYSQLVAGYNYRVLWTYAASGILGLWLITAPHLYAYKSEALAASDTISGAAIIVLEALSFSARLYYLRWLTPVVAIWLLFAPLVFWSPAPATYLSDTIIACLVITLSLLVPGAPGQGGISKPGPDMPPGWSYNPSSWIRRWLGIALALLGFLISRYLAARQLGYIPHAWDPFFGNSSERVLHSVISRSFPISDAGFGSVAYMLEVLAGFMGDRARWRTAPWVVTTFAVLVVPLGVTSIVLVILQPVVVGAWCGLCLIAAVGLLLSVPLAVHEIIAMGQFLVAAKTRGKSLWNTFWTGGGISGAGGEDPDRRHFNLGQRWVASVQGITVPLPIVVEILIGIWLMACPDVLRFQGWMANADHFLGALIVTASAVATAEVTRTARLLNILLAVCLAACAFAFGRDLPVALVSELACAVLLIPVSVPKGEIIESYAGWHKFIK